MALATDRASREAQGYTRAGFEFVERLVEIPGRNPVKNYALTTYWDPPNAPLNTLNPRNLNNAEQYVLGQLVEGADADRLAVGSKENRF
jgi:hypothetical protein